MKEPDFDRAKPIDEDTPLPPLEQSLEAYVGSPRPEPLPPSDETWADVTLKSLSLPEKVGQLFITSQLVDIQKHCSDLAISGIAFVGNEHAAREMALASQRIKDLCRIPPFICLDAEVGIGGRVLEGTSFPYALSYRSISPLDLLKKKGEIIAREAKALGLNMIFGPVLDLYSDHVESAIAVRAFDSMPELAEAKSLALAKSIYEHGILPCLKHYPGHGGATGDSHNALPVDNRSLSVLKENDLLPYANLTNRVEVPALMTAHVQYTGDGFHYTGAATHSEQICRDILRNSFQYEGLLITDAINMEALVKQCPDEGERALRSFEAGCDIVLHVHDLENCIGVVLASLAGGRLSREWLDNTVRRILLLKSRLLPGKEANGSSLAFPVKNHRIVARELAESIPFSRPSDSAFSMSKGSATPVPFFELQSDQLLFYRYPLDPFKKELSVSLNIEDYGVIPRSISEDSQESLFSCIRNAEFFLICCKEWRAINSQSQIQFLKELQSFAPRCLFLGFGSPAIRHQLPKELQPRFVTAYSTHPESQRAFARHLAGLLL